MVNFRKFACLILGVAIFSINVAPLKARVNKDERIKEWSTVAGSSKPLNVVDESRTETVCVSWRQTSDCDPDGTVEDDKKQDCSVTIDDGWSGYCECSGGIKTMKKTCAAKTSKSSRTCNEACKAYSSGCTAWRQTSDCDSSGTREEAMDKRCAQVIDDGWSGYCECTDGTKTMEKGCEEGCYCTCNDACLNKDNAGATCNNQLSNNNDGCRCENSNNRDQSMNGITCDGIKSYCEVNEYCLDNKCGASQSKSDLCKKLDVEYPIDSKEHACSHKYGDAYKYLKQAKNACKNDVNCKMVQGNGNLVGGCKSDPGTSSSNPLDFKLCSSYTTYKTGCSKNQGCSEQQRTCTHRKEYVRKSGPYIRLYQGNDVTQDELCTIDLDQDVMELNKGAFNDKGCPNDKARSLTICNLKEGATLFLCDNDKCKDNDDIVRITAKQTMEGCQDIGTFEKTQELDDLLIVYSADTGSNWGNISWGILGGGPNLDGKVSGICYYASGQCGGSKMGTYC